LEVKKKIFDEKKLGKLWVSTRSGETTDDLGFASRRALSLTTNPGSSSRPARTCRAFSVLVPRPRS